MLLVDNLRVLLLVDLIFVSGISSAEEQANSCYNGSMAPPVDCQSDDQVCGVSLTDASLVGCVNTTTCGYPVPADKNIVCNSGAANCCCKPFGCPCVNQFNACTQPKLKDLPKCSSFRSGGSTGGSEPSSTGAATSLSSFFGTMVLSVCGSLLAS